MSQQQNTPEIGELLEAAKKAGDLRRSETLRLIEASKKVASRIADVAKETATGARVVMETENIMRNIDIERNTILATTVEGKILLTTEDNYDGGYGYTTDVVHELVIAYSSDSYEVDGRISDGTHGVPKNDTLWATRPGAQCYRQRGDNLNEIMVTTESAPGTYISVPEDWFETLEKVPKLTHSITRSEWIRVARNLLPLAQALQENAAKKETETKDAMILAEKLKKALESYAEHRECNARPGLQVPGKEKEMKKIKNLHNDYSEYVEDAVIDRAAESNGPTEGCIALMPEDWPKGTTEDNNLWIVETEESS